MGLLMIFYRDKDVIQIYNYKNNKFLSQNFVNIALETFWSIWQVKKYDLIYEIGILNLKGCFPFIAFFDLYFVIRFYQIKLKKLLGMAWLVKQLIYQGQLILVFNGQVIKTIVIHTKAGIAIRFLHK